VADRLEVRDPDGLTSVVFRWLPPAGTPTRAVLHVMHGWCEHALRYDRPATALANTGIVVYADDHRGHGATGQHNGTTGDLGPGGMEGVVEAVHAVTEAARAEHPAAPVFALGHSWGSMILFRYLQRFSDGLAGAILTGTTLMTVGREGPADLNGRFEPARTPYDWLTRDEAEVDKYVADPLCGFEIMQGRRPTADDPKRGTDAPIRPDLPILVVNGADDPVGGEEGARLLAEHFAGLGVTDVRWKAYEGARHELLNETSRDEVLGDLQAWLDGRISA
jgi:alpha-beta hydrolase superfamily lysophospholipase